ncbi:MAG: pyruvate, phosphate dikinase [Myxococcales bacterium]|nr:pyruvate, phosphate dikinase [Myxococcales bacterium]MBL0198059.1 pyruvate, phosphate dikinase [Myxococcales bacterium]HQY62156.1 pyruvate, phosphate dikinase [Polyangiaceae bacterium]
MTHHVYSFGGGGCDGDPSRKDLLGGKGAGLAEMSRIGLPVPPGFTISTEVCQLFKVNGALPADVREAVHAAMGKIEAELGMKFGDPSAPLLVSVRSGARASMPGMMDTILNLGLNDATCEGLAARTKNARFAYDAYRRFVAMFADVALGIKREAFDHALDEARMRVARARGVDVTLLNSEELKRRVPDSELDEAELRGLVTTFKALVLEKGGRPFPEDPTEQLLTAIGAVFGSWSNHRAIVYRKMHDIPESWGTACNIQAMVFGNLGDTSATGVAFTRNPSTGERRLYGEWLPNAQGEDVVAGIRTPLPLLAEGGDGSLEARMPKAFAELAGIAERLEKHFRDMQDLEFTVQDGKLYMLQCRTGKRTARAAVRAAVEMVREGLISKEEAVLRVPPSSLDQLLHPTLDPRAERRLLATGLAASPGAAQGHIVFHADEAERLAEKGKPVILVRVETSPEDIHGMKAARGIITARGGMTSHAAVVARGMGKACVAGCSAIQVSYASGTMSVTLYDENGRMKGTAKLKRGDLVTIDGGTGQVFEGAIPTVPASLSGEFGELMAWADECRTLRVRANADTPLDAKTARAFGAEGIGLCRTEHMFFDEERIRAMREMILSDEVTAREKALAKLLPVQKDDFIGIFKEMDGLPVTIRLLDPPLHEFLPQDERQIAELATIMNVSALRLEQRIKDLHEYNPMLGHRGCRLAITYPEIYAMQVRAILLAALEVTRAGVSCHPEIMIPLAMTRTELERMKELVLRVAAEVFEGQEPIPYSFGTMIELPRAALRANELAEVAEFFSFGTNDLTQCTMGLSRDDAGKFLPAYVDSGVLPKDPFVSLDQDGVGELVKLACERGRAARPGMKLGVCGEHGGDPASVAFFHRAGLDYVSCSPFRVAIARLAAAQAEIERRGKLTAGSTN